jgi:hypothetical protein
MIKVTGNTYPAQNLLKKCGFIWDSKQKAYFGDSAAKDELDRISTATASRANQKLVLMLKFKEEGENE